MFDASVITPIWVDREQSIDSRPSTCTHARLDHSHELPCVIIEDVPTVLHAVNVPCWTRVTNRSSPDDRLNAQYYIEVRHINTHANVEPVPHLVVCETTFSFKQSDQPIQISRFDASNVVAGRQ